MAGEERAAPDIDGYIHMSETPIESLRNDLPLKEGIYFRMNGKPQGLWYTTGLLWPSILEEIMRAKKEGAIETAIRTSLGLVEAINNTEQPSDRIASKDDAVFVYDIIISEDKKTTDIRASDPTKILVLSQENLRDFLEQHWNVMYESQLTPAIFYKIKYIMDPMFSKQKPISMYNFILRFVSVCASLNGEEHIPPPWEEPMRAVDLTSASEITKFLNKNMVNMRGYFIEQLTKNKASLSELLMRKGDGPFQEFWPSPKYKSWSLNKFIIEEMIWNAFWTMYFPKLFGGVEFDESVIYKMEYKDVYEEDIPDVPFWAKTLDIPSGCLFRPKAMGIELRHKVTVGLDPSVKNVEYNVYGLRKTNRVVVRTYKASGGKRTKKTKKGKRKSRKSRKVFLYYM